MALNLSLRLACLMLGIYSANPIEPALRESINELRTESSARIFVKQEKKRNFSKEDLEKIVLSASDGLFEVDSAILFPYYLLGDYNGDGIDDLVIAVKLVNNMLVESDKPLPFWAGKPTYGKNGKESHHIYKISKYKDMARYKTERVLLILHGAMQKDWQYDQKFALLDAMNFDSDYMERFKGNLPQTVAGDEKPQPPPKLLGYAILLLHDRQGLAIYWDGKGYSWYPVN